MKLTLKQTKVLDYLEDDHTSELLAGGAAGFGKSLIGCYWLLKCCLRYPGSRWLLGRNELKRLKNTTLKTFLEVASMQGVKNRVHFRINLNTHVIEFNNGSEICLMDLSWMPSDPNYERLGSLELTGAFIDEASEITARAADIVASRIRFKLDEFKLVPKLLMTCNPSKNWIYQDFYKPWRAGKLKHYQKFVPATARDNPYLSPAYLENLKRLNDVDRERLLEGNWDYDNDPAQLISYEKICNLFTNDFVKPGERFLSCDLAMQGADKFTVFAWSGWRVIGIHDFEKTTGKELEKKIREYATRYEVPRANIVFDSDGLGEFLGSYLEGAVPFHNNGSPLTRLEKTGDEFKENYANLKTQCYFFLTRMINTDQIFIEGLEHTNSAMRETISEELQWVKRDKLDDDGKLHILSKKKVKEGLGRSPDFADALAMRCYFAIDRQRARKAYGAASDDDLLGDGGGYVNDDYDAAEGY
jgi:hypothetical protein